MKLVRDDGDVLSGGGGGGGRRDLTIQSGDWSDQASEDTIAKGNGYLNALGGCSLPTRELGAVSKIQPRTSTVWILTDF
jgi:hypothetical protein